MRIMPRLVVLLPVLFQSAGCSPFDFAPTKAVVLSPDRLLALAEEGSQNHIYYAGSDYEYHYLVDTRPGHGQAYKIEPRHLRLSDTFDRGEDEPYVVYPHVIKRKKLGAKPREMPGLQFEPAPGLAQPMVPSKPPAAGGEDARSASDQRG